MRTFALAIATLLLLGACTDDPEPIEPEPSKSTPTAPKLPAAAQSATPKGQIAFVGHVVSTLNYSVDSGSTEELKALFAPECKACKQYVDRVASDNSDKGHVDGFEWRVTRGQVLEGDKVEINVKASPYRKADPNSGKFSNVKGADYQLGFKLDRRNGTWLVQELYVPEPT